MTAAKPSCLVPRLRFPEFRNAPQWKPKKLGQIGELVGGGTPDTSVPEYWGGNIQWYTPTEVKDRNLSKSKRTITREGLNNSSAKLLPIGSLLITTRASIGDIGVADSPCATNQGFQSLIVAESEANTFWYYWLVQHGSELTKRASGSTFLEIGKTELKKIPVLRPDEEEQRKIADCLGSLDDLIAAEGRKLQTLRLHKKGLVQQLFPQPGETVPQLRFPEFRYAPDWERAALGTLLVRPPEYGANAAAVPFSEDLPAYIRITDIDDDGRFIPAPRVSVDIEPNDDQYLQPGDVVFARTGASVGKSYCHLGEGGRLVYAGFLIRVRPNPERLSSQFLAAYLSTWGYWDWVRLTSARSGQPGINGTEYASMPLPLPPDGRDLAEQQKIADCIGSLDDLIAAEGRRLDALKQHKQGLMQQILPNLEAASR